MIAAAEAASADWRLLYGGRHRASMAFLGALARYGDRVTVAPQDETGLLDLDSLLGTPQPDTPGLLLRPGDPYWPPSRNAAGPGHPGRSGWSGSAPGR